MQQSLAQKEKMYEQDAMSRMQLGRRLEQVLMDKEEAVEQLEMMKVCLSLPIPGIPGIPGITMLSACCITGSTGKHSGFFRDYGW